MSLKISVSSCKCASTSPLLVSLSIGEHCPVQSPDTSQLIHSIVVIVFVVASHRQEPVTYNILPRILIESFRVVSDSE